MKHRLYTANILNLLNLYLMGAIAGAFSYVVSPVAHAEIIENPDIPVQVGGEGRQGR